MGIVNANATGNIMAEKTNLDKWLALKKKKTATNRPQTIANAPADVVIPLSYGQQRLWFLQQLYPDNPFYNYAHQYHFKGALDAKRLIASFQAIAQKQQVLLTTFKEEEGKIVQSIQEGREIPVEYFDLRELTPENKTQEFAQISKEAFRHTFDLTQDVLLRLTLIQLGEEEHLLLLLIHHIVGDRTSLQLLNKEVAQNYQTNESTPLAIQYADFSYWQRQQKIKSTDLDYWLKQLAGELPVLQLPYDFIRPNTASFKGKTLTKQLSKSLSQQLKQLATEQNTTLFVVGLAGFKTLLSRYTQQTDILVGVPFSNRDKTNLEQLIGFFNETLVLRSNLATTPTFVALVQQLKQTTIDAFAHKNVPFDRLVQELKPDRQGGNNPIFQVMFVFNDHSKKVDFGADLVVTEQAIDLDVSKFDLTLFLTDEGEHINLSLEYENSLFEQNTIERILGHLEILLRHICKNPKQDIGKYDLLTSSEKEQILETWNPKIPALPTAPSIQAYLERIAEQHPNRTAVSYQNESLTYQDLNKRATQVAQVLQEVGIGRNMLVGLFAERSLELIIGIWGILKAGAAYLPLDPEYPEERIQYMLEDAGATVVLVQAALQVHLTKLDIKSISIEGTKTQRIDTIELPKTEAQDLVYMIYTSGSTGRPKGVPITQHNLLHSTMARFAYYERSPGAFLLLSSFSFDSSVAGIFWTFCNGGTLVLPPQRMEQDIHALATLIAKENVTHTLLLPSLYSVLLEYAPKHQLRSLENVIVAGEVCPPILVQQHFEKLSDTLLYNEYGPTEGTVWSTAHQMTPEDAAASIPIGQPIPNTNNFILDKNLQLVPVGIQGELYIGGEGIAQGYWQRPELTATRFIAHPLSKNKLYKTGDLVRYRPNGLIDFLGRADHQVKIRGHRIELDEIRNVLLQVPLVRDAIAVIKEQRIIAYLLANTAVNKSGVRHWLRSKLPNYMQPSALVMLEAFPRLPNGKIDQAALSSITNSSTEINQETKPTSELESKLLAIWQSVLETNEVQVSDNFFEIGGDSIRTIQIIAKAQQQDIQLAPNHLFDHQSIRALATFLEQKGDEAQAWASLMALKKGESKLPLFCIHSGGGHVLFYRSLVNYLDEQHSVYALQAKGINGKEAIHDSIEEMAAHYVQEIKRIQPNGPYALLGTCFSNAVGLEMAHQLRAAGDKIELLVFVDSGPAHLTSAKTRGENKTAQRFGKMLKTGDWGMIRKKLNSRLAAVQRKITKPFKESQEIEFQETLFRLNKLYRYYNWQPYEGKVVFIRSSEFAERKDKDYHIEQWTKLATLGLETHVVAGHHLTLFEEPEVKGLAEVLEQVLSEKLKLMV